MISFIIIFHPSRIKNLKQTLRFLSKRENCLEELILICQTKCENLDSPFKKTKQINLNLDSYWKSKMTNIGVDESTKDILVLLDSDRILPKNYFNNPIKKKQVVSSSKLIKLIKNYSDKEIEEKNIKFEIDYKTKNNVGRTKNLFAGNTIIFKEDYLNLGGYDEKYKGYGYADTDMSRKVMKSDLEIVWKDVEEIHLFHEPVVSWNSGYLNNEYFKIQTAINGFKYYRKWKIKIENEFLDLINQIDNSKLNFPSELFEEYKSLKNKFKKHL